MVDDQTVPRGPNDFDVVEPRHRSQRSCLRAATWPHAVHTDPSMQRSTSWGLGSAGIGGALAMAPCKHAAGASDDPHRRVVD